ncbi:aldehyde dehydrogenase family protein [Brevibacillus ruminantium]|uniref:Aldehyde dehydrogenase family protein n=1 Tax=Brevibacillus ruminantium TaxID=2950604 RepID=A0ABY4WL62_9BACL|nr:aldehyde dehydrogenase family protein [Brevibacillus ruminantium]USG66595.1 aldehyde dehydrogenase family protein [Brevibacillus ruminantium]
MHGSTVDLELSIPLLQRREAIARCISFIESNPGTIRDILTEISTYQTAELEIQASLQALKNAIHEVHQYQPPLISTMSVFMPSNVILYSYVLYLLIPSLYVNQIEFRSSMSVLPQVRKLHEVLKEVHQLPFALLELSHREYIKSSVLQADVVVFTGTYQNAESIKQQLSKQQMFIFFGQGINPFIVSETANLEKAVHDLIQVRLYNTGQDCMGPDVIYVSQSQQDAFLTLLTAKLDGLRFGSNQEVDAAYGPIHYTETLEMVGQHLNQYGEHIVYGGRIDFRDKVIQPTVLVSALAQKLKILEFFSPVFNVVIYEKEEDLKRIVTQEYFVERALGATFYGHPDSPLIELLRKKHTVSINETLFDIENGNAPFGGYGPMANFVFYQGELIIKPILISQILSEYWQRGDQ